MKVSRLFTIDVELAEKLKQSGNQSSIINNLLKEHFSTSSKKSGIIEQKQAIFSNMKKKMRDLRKEIKIFADFEKLSIDNFGVRWLKGQESEPSIFAIKSYTRGRELNNTTEQYLKGWKLINEHGDLFEKY
jgi:hypothetical protein